MVCICVLNIWSSWLNWGYEVLSPSWSNLVLSACKLFYNGWNNYIRKEKWFKLKSDPRKGTNWIKSGFCSIMRIKNFLKELNDRKLFYIQCNDVYNCLFWFSLTAMSFWAFFTNPKLSRQDPRFFWMGVVSMSSGRTWHLYDAEKRGSKWSYFRDNS